MSFNNDASPTDTSTSSTETDLDFGPPTDGHVVAIAVTVGVVGVFLFVLITWLLLRLRRRPADEVDAAPSPRIRCIFTSDNTRPSTESKFSFMRVCPLSLHGPLRSINPFSPSSPINLAANKDTACNLATLAGFSQSDFSTTQIPQRTDQ